MTDLSERRSFDKTDDYEKGGLHSVILADIDDHAERYGQIENSTTHRGLKARHVRFFFTLVHSPSASQLTYLHVFTDLDDRYRRSENPFP